MSHNAWLLVIVVGAALCQGPPQPVPQTQLAPIQIRPFKFGKGITAVNGVLQIDSTVPQTGASNAWVGRNDFGGASFFAPPHGPAEPAGCTQPQMYFNETAHVLKICIGSPGVWKTIAAQ